MSAFRLTLSTSRFQSPAIIKLSRNNIPEFAVPVLNMWQDEVITDRWYNGVVRVGGGGQVVVLQSGVVWVVF